MNHEKVIAIDHGNRNIKTPNKVFSAKCGETNHLPPMGRDVLVYNGREYTIDNRCPSRQLDKTKSDDYFILTLFAVCKEVFENTDYLTNISLSEPIPVVILAGLPLTHYRDNKAAFKKYLTERENPICVEFNSHPLRINIKEVFVYPQAYAASLTIADKIGSARTLGIVDIGGHTIDCLELTNGIADIHTCTTFYKGVNFLFQGINEKVRAKLEKDMSEDAIETILKGENPDGYPTERITMIRETATEFVRLLLLDIAQTRLDVTNHQTLFVGGGATLLKEYIERDGTVAKPIFVENVHANAYGYLLMYNMQATRA